MQQDTWHTLKVTSPRELSDPLSGLLMDMGANGCWADGDTLLAYFSTAHRPDEISHAISAFFGHLAAEGVSTEAIEFTWETTEDGDWITAWQSHFKPIPVGNRLIVLPEWVDVAEANGRLPVRIRPGYGFGTGGHDTTALCMEALERFYKHRPGRSGATVLDVGTGSGILAITACKLGTGTVTAFDNNPASVGNAETNVALNDVPVHLFLGEIDAVSGRFDLIVANLISHIVVELMPAFAERLADGGTLVLSGILNEQNDAIDQALAANGLAATRYESRGMWLCVEAQAL